MLVFFFPVKFPRGLKKYTNNTEIYPTDVEEA